ncbi:MAG TPA: hypothetical protein VL362_00835 [Patescibacteria group bacterium]|nr:hypothetical protein [Patescibacteria group bacterium]
MPDPAVERLAEGGQTGTADARHGPVVAQQLLLDHRIRHDDFDIVHVHLTWVEPSPSAMTIFLL